MPIDLTKLTLQEILELKAQLDRIQAGAPAAQNNHDRRCRVDWTAVDWTKTNLELSRELGVWASYIGQVRRKLGNPKVTRLWPAAKSWDWSQPNSVLAVAHGAGLATVQKLRRRVDAAPVPEPYYDHGAPLPAVIPPARERIPVDWAEVDWTKPDIDLAHETGVTRERVRQRRLELGQPKALKWMVSFDRFKKQFEGRTELDYVSARKEFPLSSQTFISYCARLGIQRVKSDKPSHIPWDRMNWQLPNALRAEIWRLKGQNAVAHHRCNHVKPKAQFRWGRVRHPRIPPGFEAAVAEERGKADTYFSQTANQPRKDKP